jgi:hypothetical protein
VNDSEGDRTDGDRTVVGGRPRGQKEAGPRVPRGAETVFRKASLDSTFCQRLLDQRGSAAYEAGIRLTMAEDTILASVPRTQLQAMIDHMQVSEAKRRAPPERTPPAQGRAPDPLQATLGIRPERLEEPTSPATRGIRPDLPGETPPHLRTQDVQLDDD